ncbi:hypothetical protein BOTCAL_0505g00050 [Botryotinia calthae]|uniref:Fungal N-terminal domain-containing protein n=1 Tax=Botryotinia calthae TaxID=38488 RepID=A0A4Y8CM12_9HELO|nr:hypothetical protein BOTCAL_0505g00050 [Botryotinia calthae]
MHPVSVLGLTASIIACIQLAQALSKKVGLYEHNRTDIERMPKTLRRFLVSYQGLKNIAAIDETVEKHAQQAPCDTRDIKENAQRIEDHIRDLEDDALDIRHDISL